MDIAVIVKLTIKISIPIIACITWIYNNFFKLKNLLLRPKIFIDTQQQRIVFIDQDDREHHYPYFCLIVTNNSNKTLSINPRQIKINNELYQVIIQMEENFLLLNPVSKRCWKDCKNDIYKMYRSNWYEISQGNFSFTLTSYEKKLFPMTMKQTAYRIITGVKKGSLLFRISIPLRRKGKVSITLEINKKIYEYGLDREYVYEKYFEYLAIYTSVHHGAVMKKLGTEEVI